MREFPPGVSKVGHNLATVAGSYLRTVTSGDWEACTTCALPVRGYTHCPQCSTHINTGLALADRTGFLVYADRPNSQAYRMMFGYKQQLLRPQFEPVVRALLAVGLRAHFTCAAKLADTDDSGWAVVPSTKGRSVLAELVRGLSRSPSAEVVASFTGVIPNRTLSPQSWMIAHRAAMPAHVMVIDDSWVTGSSAQSLACSLKQAGVRQVSILSAARVLSPDWEPNKGVCCTSR